MQPLQSSEPSRIGDYRLLGRIGRGSMGAVYLARSRGGRTVAVKLVRPDLAEDPEFRERFRRETRMSEAVGGFWTAAVVDADPDAEQPWLATEYVPGPTLHQAVSDHGPLPEHTVRSLAAGLAEALRAIHGADLVHRDLKPGNVLLGPDGPRVIDFGISRAVTASAMTATGMFFGTPGYFSPEQTLGTAVGPASDVFSLGAVLAFAATGGGPFGNDHTAAMLYRVAHSEPDLGAVPEGLRPLVATCLAKDPAARPTPTAILDWIGEALPQGGTWLPDSVTALVGQHDSQLDRAARATRNGHGSSGGPDPRAHHPATVVDPNERSPAAPNGHAQPQHRGQPAPVTRAPAAPPATPQAHAPRPAVDRNLQGPTFRTRGRGSALLSALFVFALAYGAVQIPEVYAAADAARPVFRLGVACLLISGVLSLLRAVTPGLRLRINSAGIRVSRVGLHQEIPWSQVERVAVVGRGRRQALAVWVTPGSELPRSTWWHRVRRHHGGHAVFPVGSTGGWWTRRQEAKRVRVTLERYAPWAYDPRPL